MIPQIQSFYNKCIESEVNYEHKSLIFDRLIVLECLAGSVSLLKIKEDQVRFIKAVLILFSAFLMFGGPTYLILIIQRLDIPYPILILIGLSSFTVGVILFIRLIQEEKT